MVVTLGREYNTGEKPTVMLYTCNDTRQKQNKNISEAWARSDFSFKTKIFPFFVAARIRPSLMESELVLRLSQNLKNLAKFQ